MNERLFSLNSGAENDTAKELWFECPDMSEREFRRFSELIYEQCGIKLAPVKKTMLSARLLKRLRALGVKSYRQYYDYVCGPEGFSEELIHMIDAVTTNKTEFFREPTHFDFLLEQALPTLFPPKQTVAHENLFVWSAGCSSGEEAYSLAMILSEFFSKRQAGGFSILATDISTRVLAAAKRGIYPYKGVESVPPMLKRKYLMRGKNSQEGFCRVVPELRSRITFQRQNLMDEDFEISKQVDVLFCRNVIIYFGRQTQTDLFKKFYAQMKPGGYLFIGHSETLHGINNQFVPVAGSVYRKPE
jgi:chemotaxis protein methyltransferase CheR